jgi:hypothetical protein
MTLTRSGHWPVRSEMKTVESQHWVCQSAMPAHLGDHIIVGAVAS